MSLFEGQPYEVVYQQMLELSLGDIGSVVKLIASLPQCVKILTSGVPRLPSGC